MPKFRVRPGFTHGAQKQYKAGDIVELTEEEAAGFLDKLEPARGKKAQTDESSDLRTAIDAATDKELAEALGVDADALTQLRAGKGATKPDGLVVNPKPDDAPATKSEAVKDVEQELEAETGVNFTKSGDNPPTLVETDSKPVGRSRR